MSEVRLRMLQLCVFVVGYRPLHPRATHHSRRKGRRVLPKEGETGERGKILRSPPSPEERCVSCRGLLGAVARREYLRPTFFVK